MEFNTSFQFVTNVDLSLDNQPSRSFKNSNYNQQNHRNYYQVFQQLVEDVA